MPVRFITGSHKLGKVLSKNCASMKCRAKQLAPQKMYIQMLGVTFSVVSLILQDLLFLRTPFVSHEAWSWLLGKRKTYEGKIGNINLSTTLHLRGN